MIPDEISCYRLRCIEELRESSVHLVRVLIFPSLTTLGSHCSLQASYREAARID